MWPLKITAKANVWLRVILGVEFSVNSG